MVVKRGEFVKYTPGLWVALLAANLVVSCASPERTDGPESVVIGITGEFDSLNELNATDSEALQVIQQMLFLSLTTLDERLEVIPQLARGWEFSHGDSVLTYHLRRDVLWSDGVRTTGEDVEFTCRLAMDPQVGYPAISRFDNVASVEALDDSTVRFVLKRPSPDALADTQIPILPKHRLANIPVEQLATDDFNRRPVGNGRFTLSEWTAGRQMVFSAAQNHPLGSPRVERVIFRTIPDESTLYSSLLAGSVDIVPSMTPVVFRELEGRAIPRGVRFPGRNYAFIGWNMDRPLFSRAVRRALTSGVNKQEIIRTLLEGYATPVHGPIPQFLWAYDSTQSELPFDPAKARTLLFAEGWEDSDGDGFLDRNGTPFEFTLTTNAESQLRRDVSVMIQAQMKRIGVRVNVRTIEWNLFLDQVFGKREFDAVLSAWDTDFTVNPAPLWHSDAVAEGYNVVGYRNPRVDELLEAGRSRVDRASALPVWFEFQKTIAEDAPYTFLFSQDQLAAVGGRVLNVRMDVRSYLVNVHEWDIE